MKAISKKEALEIINDTELVLVDFFATWCGPCKMIAPILDKLATDTNLGAKIIKIDVDQDQEYAQEYDIKSVPTMVILKNGKEVERFSGFRPEPAIRDIINNHK